MASRGVDGGDTGIARQTEKARRRRSTHTSGPYDWTQQVPVPPDARWPSVLLAAGLNAPLSTDHTDPSNDEVPFPDWWRAIVSRGDAFHPDADQALHLASGYVRRFRGHPVLNPVARDFVRSAVLDGLCMAPAPVTTTWVRFTLAATSGIVRWVDLTGRPLTREVVFSEETIRTWLQTRRMGDRSADVYLTRLWLLGGLFSGAPYRELPRVAAPNLAGVTDPHSPAEQEALWRWTAGLSRPELRHRVRMFLVLGFGLGLRAAEKVELIRNHVTIAEDGIDVRLLDKTTGSTRAVTCLADWEERFQTLLNVVPARRPLLTPWKKTVPRNRTNGVVVAKAQRHSCPVPFTSRSLRHTWIVRHLAAGTPLDVILSATGLQEVRQLAPFLRWVPPADPQTARRALRGLRTPDSPIEGER